MDQSDASNSKKRPAKTASARGNGVSITRINAHASLSKRRRDSFSEAARDPGGEPVTKKTKLPTVNPTIDFDGLSRPSKGTRERIDEREETEERLERMRGAVKTLLECVGEDPDREGLLDTPLRYAKALLFFTKGYQVNFDKLLNNALFREGHNEMVIVKDIEIYSLCEHHLVPFTGKIHIGYIPSDTVIGLSKLSRIAEAFSQRLQIQERLTKEVAHAIMEIINPQGVAVVTECSHLCMAMRSTQKTGSTVTSCVLGCFKKNSKTRNEFLRLVGVGKV